MTAKLGRMMILISTQLLTIKLRKVVLPKDKVAIRKLIRQRKRQKKKNKKSRRSSVSTDGSLSPTMALFENLSKQVEDLPVGRRTRRSVGHCSQNSETVLENINPSSTRARGRGKGRGRGSGRGRGRGKNHNSISENNNDTNSSAISISSVQELSSNEVSEKEDDTSYQPNESLNIMERFLQQGRTGRTRVMRARRQYIAEIAARSTQVDYVDLVSSPMPRVEGFIDLDTYAEEELQRTTRSKKKNQTVTKPKKIPESKNAALEISFDEDNPELNIKVNWKGKPEAFKLRKHQKFSVIFEQLAKRENIGMENIVFNLNDRIVMADDTPDSISYKIFHFIDGRVLSNSFSSPKPAVGKKRDANKITLKIQSDKWKKPLQIDMMKSDKFRILYIKCAEELKVGLDQLKLSFDGELLELNDTPTDLDLEGGEAIDLHMKD